MSADASSKSQGVLLFAHNDAGTIEETLHRLHEQFPEERALVLTAVDLGSTDGTVGLLKRFKPNRLIQFQQENSSMGHAMNRVLEQLLEEGETGPILFLRANTVPDQRDWMLTLKRQLAMNPRTGLVISPRIPNCRAFPLIRSEIFRSHTADSESWIEDPGIIAAGILRPQVWRENPLRTDLEGYELGEWAHRIEQNGWLVASAADALVRDIKPLSLRETYHCAFRAAYSLATCRGELSGIEAFQINGRRLFHLTERNLRDLGRYLRQGQIFHWPRVVLGRFFLTAGEIRGYARGLRGAVPSPAGSASKK